MQDSPPTPVQTPERPTGQPVVRPAAPSPVQSAVRSAARSALRFLASARAFAAGLVAVRRPGVRPPLDVRQTCVLMFAVAPAYGLLAYLAWDRMSSGLPGDYANDLRTLAAAAVVAGLLPALLAVPVRRGGHGLWRTAQVGAVAALGVALSALHTAARLADTQLLLAGVLVALAAIFLNIALWSSEVRRWCGL